MVGLFDLFLIDGFFVVLGTRWACFFIRSLLRVLSSVVALPRADSFNAFNTVEMLRDLAVNGNRTVMMTIHHLLRRRKPP